MKTSKEKMIDLIQSQPEDSSVEEILQQLSMSAMIERGIQDSMHNRVISHDQIKEEIKHW
jgi:hypothetical protein